jgi:hypothetical protein
MVRTETDQKVKRKQSKAAQQLSKEKGDGGKNIHNEYLVS